MFLCVAGNSKLTQQTSDDTTMMPPANDMFHSAEPIAGPDGYVNSTTLFATSEPSEPMSIRATRLFGTGGRPRLT